MHRPNTILVTKKLSLRRTINAAQLRGIVRVSHTFLVTAITVSLVRFALLPLARPETYHDLMNVLAMGVGEGEVGTSTPRSRELCSHPVPNVHGSSV